MIGIHVLLDGFGCAPERLTDAEAGGRALAAAALAANMTPLGEPHVHVFPGGGYTALLALAESHLSIHTYPERGLFCADLFTCGPSADPAAAVEVLCAALGPTERVEKTVARGELTPGPNNGEITPGPNNGEYKTPPLSGGGG